jgi:hypothetical protein
VPLVEYEEARDFLELDDDSDIELIESLIASVTSLFEKECGREAAPFSAALTARTEIIEAEPGARRIWLDYPIASIASIVLGRDVNAPDETLTPADATQVVWRVGSRYLMRTDGGVWRRDYPRWVKVVYNTLADFPDDVKLAVKRVVATIYQARGKEGFTSVTRGSRSWTMAEQAAQQDEFWQSALRNHGGNLVR